MRALTARECADLTGGRLLAGNPEAIVSEVGTDTRHLKPGSLYVALIGDRFDGHDFVSAAVEAGAAALMVSSPLSNSGGGDCAVIEVKDTLTGLQDLARGYRRSLSTRAVVITGSNGKTSTKDMIRAVLAESYPVSATRGNLNNHIGLPLTILQTDPGDAFGVWEIGMNHPGEIAPLAEIAAPDVAVITNIGTAHIGNMGSREAIAREKGMLAEALNSKGVLILNAEDDFTPSIAGRTRARVITAGIDAGDVRGSELELQTNGTRFKLTAGSESASVDLPVPGRHMVANALLAAAVGLEAGLGMDAIARALSEVRLTPGRLEVLEHRGVTVINDAYNANPDSMRAALTTAGALGHTGKRYAILGEMGELGEESERAHREIGQIALAEGFDHLGSVGEGARTFTEGLTGRPDQAIHHFQNHRDAADFLRENTRPGDLVLLKGSRSASMDSIYNLFAADPE